MNNLYISIKFFLCISLVFNTVLLFCLLKKKTNADPVILAMYNKEYGIINGSSDINTSFWNNCPYWVIITEGKKIDSISIKKFGFVQDDQYKKIIPSKTIFLRYRGQNNWLLHLLLNTRVEDISNISILTDNLSYSKESKVFDSLYSKNRIKTYISNLNPELPIEQNKLSYFFRLDNDFKFKDILLPNKFLSDVIIKYIDYQNSKKDSL